MIEQFKYYFLAASFLCALCSCDDSDPPVSVVNPTGENLQHITYLGLEPPGLAAEVFLPDILADVERGVCSGFMFDGSIFIFKLLSPETDWKYEPLYFTEFKDGSWTKPEVTPFSDLFPYNFTIAPDDKTLYFTSLRSAEDHEVILEQADVWKVAKTADGWTEPETFGPPVNSDDSFENYPSVTNDHTLYFMSSRDDGFGKDDIYRLELVDGEYRELENIGAPVNTAHPEVDPFISADESYLIFCSDKPGGFGGFDLYISFRKADGNWTEPLNMGESINSAGAEFRPSVTPDQKYFFFTSDRSGIGEIFWISTDIVQPLRQTSLAHRFTESAENNSETADFPQLKGPYLGQQPPGMSPQIFATGVLVAKDGGAINSVFSPDGKEFYYVVLEDGSPRYNLWSTRIEDEIWTKPGELRLAGEYEAADIALSPDGSRLYFCSDMPTYWEDAEGFDIWYVERKGDGWSKPVNAGRNINSPGGETQPSFTTDGTMYFPSQREGTMNGSVDLFYSEMIDGEFTKAVPLPGGVNSEYNEGNSFVAPDGSFILFARWDMPEFIDGGKGLYISFREPNGGWTEAVNTAPVLEVRGSLAALTHDGKYLLWSTPEGIHWVDVRALEQLKQQS